jgi:hypothetical protein
MKTYFTLTKHSCFFILLIFIATINSNAQYGKTLYVDQFDIILGDQAAEDDLLNYAISNGYDYISLYRLSHILNSSLNGVYPFNQVNRAIELKNFLIKAHNSTYNLKVIAIDGLNFSDVLNYEKTYTNANEQFDGYNLEDEFWNAGNIHSAWNDYETRLSTISTHAHSKGKIIETYIGRILLYPRSNPGPNQYTLDDVITGLVTLSDRILVDVYVNDPSNQEAYNFFKERFFEFEYWCQNNSSTVDLYPIFSYKCNKMAGWFQSNSIDDAFVAIDDDVNTYSMSDYSTFIQNTYSVSSSYVGLARNRNAALFSYSYALHGNLCQSGKDDPVNLCRNFTDCDTRMIIGSGKNIINSLHSASKFTFELNFNMNNSDFGCYDPSNLSLPGLYNNFLSCTDFRFGITTVGSNTKFFFQSGTVSSGQYYYSNTISVSQNVCYHFAVIYSGSIITFYLNGEDVGSINNVSSIIPYISASTYPLYIGYDEGWSMKSGGYKIDEFRIWNIADFPYIGIVSNMKLPLNGYEPGLIAYWNMDELDGQVILDITQHGFHIQSGTSYFNSQNDAIVAHSCYEYNYNFAKYFDDAQIITANTLTTSGSYDDLTVEFWMSNRGAPGTIINYSSSSALGFQVIINSNYEVQLNIGTSGSYNMVSNTVFSLNDCRHIAITIDANGSIALCSLYVNGVLDAVSSVSYANPTSLPLISSGNLVFGADYISNSYTNYYRGLLDEVRIWKFIRSSQDISTNYSTFIYGNVSNFIGYWRFDEKYNFHQTNPNQYLEDRSSNVNTAYRGTNSNVETADVYDIVSCSNVPSFIPDKNNRKPYDFLNNYVTESENKKIITEVKKLLMGEKVIIYPNPFKNEIFISSEFLASIEQIKLYDLLGKEVSVSIKNDGNMSNLKVNEPLISGIYFLTIQYNKGNTYFFKIQHL